MTTFRWASGDLLYRVLSEGQEPLADWLWGGIDPLWVRWLGPPADRAHRGRRLRDLVRPHFTMRTTGDYWTLTRKETE